MKFYITLRDSIPGNTSISQREFPIRVNSGFTKVRIYYHIDSRITNPNDNVCMIELSNLSILNTPTVFATAQSIREDANLDNVVIGSDMKGKEYLLGDTFKTGINSLSYTFSVRNGDQANLTTSVISLEFS